MYWINGKLNAQFLPDYILNFSDGFFTTARLKNGRIKLLDLHLKRLNISARRLFFRNISWPILLKEIERASQLYFDGVIKILIIRNNLEKKYLFKKNCVPFRIIICTDIPDYCNFFRLNGINLSVSPVRLSRNKLFAGIKHIKRAEQALLNVCITKTSDEFLLLDTDDNVIECCNANIFWRSKNKVFTPALIHAGVSGVMRHTILALLPTLGFSFQEVITGIESVYSADEVFITNSLLPIASVNCVDKYYYKDKILFNLLHDYLLNLEL